MKCPMCQFENRAGARFCQRCGASLESGPTEAKPPVVPLAETTAVETPASPMIVPPIAEPPIPTPPTAPEAPTAIAAAPPDAGPETPTATAPPAAIATSTPPPTAPEESLLSAEPAPSPPSSPAPLPPRSPGEVLDDRYRIDQVLPLEPERGPVNIYLATDTSPQVWVVCRACGRPKNDPADEYCPNCGAQLFNRVLIRETAADWRSWLVNPEVDVLELGHPGLMRSFWPSFQDGERLYAVSENPAGEELLSQIARPVPETQALSWALTLAQTLAYLHHEKRVVRIDLSPGNLMRNGATVQIVSLATSQVVLDPAEPAAVAIRQGDLTALGQLLGYLLAAPWDPTIQAAPDVQAIINQAIQGGLASAHDLVAALEDLIASRQFPPLSGLWAGQATDPGRVRELNEDSLLALTLTCLPGALPQPAGLYVVADGMGGHEGGEVASGMTVRFVADFVMHRLLDLAGAPLDPEMLMREAIQGANQAVRQAAQERSTDMGTTVTAALILGNRATIANVGDSRTYLVAGPGEIRRVTRDHSLVESLVAVGMIQPEEVYTHPQRNEVYRSVGDKPQVEVDTFVERLRPGDALLLCSDGLWEMVQDPFDIAALAHNAASPQAASEALVRAANEGGGEDNIAVIVVRAV